MMSVYLNSLYNLIFRNNPLLLIVVDVWRNIKAIRNLQRNMVRARHRINRMEYRMQAVEAYVEQPRPQHRFDVVR